MAKRFVLLFLCVMFTFLLGCEFNKNSPAFKNKEHLALFEGEIKEISISNSKKRNYLNTDYFMTIQKGEALTKLQDIIMQTALNENERPTFQPDFDLFIRYDSGSFQAIQLLIGQPGNESAFIFIDEEDGVYWVNAEATKALDEMLNIQKRPHMQLE